MSIMIIFIVERILMEWLSNVEKNKYPKSISFTISETNWNSHKNITADNWFCIEIVQELQKKRPNLGTVRKNKQEVPPEFVKINKKSRSVNSSLMVLHKIWHCYLIFQNKKKLFYLFHSCITQSQLLKIVNSTSTTIIQQKLA